MYAYRCVSNDFHVLGYICFASFVAWPQAERKKEKGRRKQRGKKLTEILFERNVEGSYD